VLNPLTGAGCATELKCRAARLPCAGGVVRVDRPRAAQKEAFALAASGRIERGAEALDLTVMPSLRLTGSITAPKRSVDAKGSLPGRAERQAAGRRATTAAAAAVLS
jgi:hypothetical protein